jgi:hypothetical protein
VLLSIDTLIVHLRVQPYSAYKLTVMALDDRNRVLESVKPLIFATRIPKDIGYEHAICQLISWAKFFRIKQK